MMRHFLLAMVPVLLLALLAGCGGGSSGGGWQFGQVRGRVQGAASGQTVTVRVDGSSYSTTVAPDGSFVLDNVPPGIHTLIAQSDAGAQSLVVDVTAGEATNIGEMVLADAGQISGLVTSATTQAPIAEALVTVTEMVYSLTDQMPHPVRMCYTNTRGSYTVDALPVGEYLVSVSHDGYAAASLDLKVAAGSTTPGDIALKPVEAPADTGAVAGQVLGADAGGQASPLPGVFVRLLPAGMADPGMMRPLPDTATDASGETVNLYPDALPMDKDYYAFTDEVGRYTISGVAEGDYLAVALRPGFLPAQQTVKVTADHTTNCDFTLTLEVISQGTVEGTVTNATTGQPIAGASVYAIFADVVPMDGDTGTCDPGDGAIVGPGMTAVLTDEHGHYQFTVPSTVTAIGTFADGFAYRTELVRIIPDGTVTVDLALDPVSDQRVTLYGTVQVAKNGALSPAAGASVLVSSVNENPMMMRPSFLYTATADAQGYYKLAVPAGTYNVQAMQENYFSEPLELHLFADTQQDLVLKEGIMPPMQIRGRK